MNKLRVYVKPSCVQCTSTFRALDAKGFEYEVFDMKNDPEALRHTKELGYDQAPVVVTPFGDHWSGFRPDKIDEFVEDMAKTQCLFDEIVRRRNR